MNSLIRLSIGLVALTAALSASAYDLQVDMVVNVTDAGRKIVRPDAAHPTYYYPIAKGYTEGGQILGKMPPPPAPWQVLHTIAKALYGQGYRMLTKEHQPALLLMFWWGYKAPTTLNNGGSLASNVGGGGFISPTAMASETMGAGTSPFADPMRDLLQSGKLDTNSTTNGDEMQELVMGSDYDMTNTYQNMPNPRLERLGYAARDPRYYVMISALDFNQALKKNFIVYWTARVSTPIYDHTLAEVIPTLMTDLAPSLGRDTGPRITDTPEVPEGKVIVGTPTLVTAHPASAK